jgi:hypothetical protein
MKKTIAEWLINELKKENLIDLNQKTTINLIVEQANQIEENRIIDAYNNGGSGSGKLYYDKTYGGKK